MLSKNTHKQCTVAMRREITNFYDEHGYTATCKRYTCICKTTLYNWLARRKAPNKTLQPDSRRPHKVQESKVALFYDPIVQYKKLHPKCACIQIQRYFIANREYKKISISTIWRALQKHKRFQNLVNVLEFVKIKKLTDS